jgi:hypothetical protein
MQAAQEETQEGALSGSPGEEGVVEVVAAVGIPLPRLEEAQERLLGCVLRLPAGGLLELAAEAKDRVPAEADPASAGREEAQRMRRSRAVSAGMSGRMTAPASSTSGRRRHRR